MKAIQYSRYGGGAESLQHVEIPIATPKKDELLVKLEAASLNPVDWKMQKGMLRPLLPLKLPFFPVTDVTGEVVQSGPGVKDFKPGDKVVSMLNFLKGGGLAEYAVVPLKTTVKRPPEVLPEAAGLPIAGLTALQAIRDVAGIKLDGSSKGVNLLITAASGGVGHFAVQLAKLGNVHVTATCGGRNIELVKKLGADEVLDYKTPEGASLTSPSGRKYDVVIHCASNITWSTFEPNLGTYGKVIDITPTFKSFLALVTKKITFSKKQLVPLLMIPRGENLALLVDLVKEQKLKIVVDSMYPLAKAEDAWAKIMDGHATGKVIVNI